MPSSKRYSLSTVVRQTIEELQRDGHMTTNRLVEIVRDRYPDLCEQEAGRLINEGIAKIARSAMKREAEVWKGGQGDLPLEIANIRLPNSVSLPPTNGGKDVEWTRIEEATFRQLCAHTEHLGRQVSYDMARFKELKRLEAILRPHMAGECDDEPIGPWLVMLKEQAA